MKKRIRTKKKKGSMRTKKSRGASGKAKASKVRKIKRWHTSHKKKRR